MTTRRGEETRRRAAGDVETRRMARLRPELLLLVGALLQAAAGVSWLTGRLGSYPFAAGEQDIPVSLFTGADPALVGGGLLLIAMVAAVTAVLTAVDAGLPRPAANLLDGTGWFAAAGLILLVPDHRLLAAVAYTPILAVGAPFGWPDGASIAQAWPWEVVYLGATALWGLTWPLTLVVRRRQGSVRSAALGGPVHVAAAWTTPEAAARWGRGAVAVAVTIPLLYAATRWAWALGIPLGISDEALAQGAETGLWWAGAALALLAVIGAGLTLGLTQRWGEVVPRWVPGLGGREIRPAAATVPAGLVAVLVTSAGMGFTRLALVGAFDDFFAGSGWAVIGPELLWPLWGGALGAAALAYHLRRRGRPTR